MTCVATCPAAPLDADDDAAAAATEDALAATVSEAATAAVLSPRCVVAAARLSRADAMIDLEKYMVTDSGRCAEESDYVLLVWQN